MLAFMEKDFLGVRDENDEFDSFNTSMVNMTRSDLEDTIRNQKNKIDDLTTEIFFYKSQKKAIAFAK